MRLLTAAGLASSVALTACGLGEGAGAAPAPSTPPATASSGQPSGTAGSAPSPTDEQSLAFLMALGRVDPRLGGDPDVALAAAQEVCVDITAGKPDAEVAALSAERFSAQGVSLDPEQGAQIAAAVQNAFCR